MFSLFTLPAPPVPWHEDHAAAEDPLYDLARRYALGVARRGFVGRGRGAAVAPWPPEERLLISFVSEVDCAPFGPDVMRRVAQYDPDVEFVLVFLSADGSTDAYTYQIPEESAADWPALVVH